jgi:hypothetical protein
MGRDCVFPGGELKPTGFKRCAGGSPRPARRTGWALWVPVIAVVASLVLLPARAALAWCRLAHRASDKLADSRLSPRTHAAIRELFEPGESLADASTWADEHSHDIPGSPDQTAATLSEPGPEMIAAIVGLA